MLPRQKHVVTAQECANRRKNKFQNLIEPASQIIGFINKELLDAADRNDTQVVYEIPAALSDYPFYKMDEMEDLLISHFEKNGYVVTLARETHVLFLDFGHVEPSR